MSRQRISYLTLALGLAAMYFSISAFHPGDQSRAHRGLPAPASAEAPSQELPFPRAVAPPEPTRLARLPLPRAEGAEVVHPPRAAPAASQDRTDTPLPDLVDDSEATQGTLFAQEHPIDR